MSLEVGTRVSFKAMQGDNEIEVYGTVRRTERLLKPNWSLVQIGNMVTEIRDDALTVHPVPVHSDDCASLLYGENGEVPGDMPCDCGGNH